MFNLDTQFVVTILGAVLFLRGYVWHELMPLRAHECCAS